MRPGKITGARSCRGWAALIQLVVFAGGVAVGGGQLDYWSGQNVAPVFEGWERNPDGTFNFVFGYFNRNHEEVLDIPIGPENSLEPGGPDQGQPTFFAPLRNKFVFRVKVPKDWGSTKRLVWTLTLRGKTEKANAFLLPEWEINEQVIGGNSGTLGSAGGGDPANKAPTITVSSYPASVALQDTITVTASVSDDGRPRLRRSNFTREEALAAGRVDDRRLGQLRVEWLQYRGPVGGRAAFTPNSAPVTDGKAVTTVTFTAPGKYLLRGFASDGELTMPTDVIVTVEPASSLAPVAIVR